MLSGDFYTCQTISTTQSLPDQWHISSLVKLNQVHPVYSGHFPGNPVVPGVCQVQMIRETVEQGLNQRLRLSESDNIKFLKMISPLENPVLEIDIMTRLTAGTQLSVSATIFSGSSVFLKFKGKFDTEG